jgi:hypothetical protein
MIELADIFRRFGPQYRSTFGDAMPKEHLKAMWAIEHCRTETMGGNLYHCESCGEIRYSYHSCGNRHCPKCGNDDAELWLEKQFALLLPQTYFLVTFTLPAQLRSVARSNQTTVYDLMFKASSQALKKLSLDPKFIGGQVGMVGVLHTWARDLAYHPHIHFIVPGGGLSAEGRWLCAKNRFLVPVKALSKIYKAKFRDQLRKTELWGNLDPDVFEKDWVVHSKPVGSGKPALKYLAPYVYRVALTNNRIEKLDNDRITFRYRESDTGMWRRTTLPALEFIRRFLQHVLPRGLHKIRYYGLLSSINRKRLNTVKRLLLFSGTVLCFILDQYAEKPPVSESGNRIVKKLVCRKCGGALKLVREILPHRQRAPPLRHDLKPGFVS